MMRFGISDFGHMLSVGTIRFEDRFCAGRKGGTGGGGLVYPSGWQCMAAVTAGCRKALFRSLKVYTLKKFATAHSVAKFFPLRFTWHSMASTLPICFLHLCSVAFCVAMVLSRKYDHPNVSGWQCMALLQLAVENPSQQQVGQLSAFLHKWA